MALRAATNFFLDVLSHFKPKRPQFQMTFYQIMSKNIIKFCFKGRKKSLAGRSLTMSDKEPRYSVTNSPMFRYVTSQKYDLFAFSYKNLALKIKFS
jgi:hypothetical protein